MKNHLFSPNRIFIIAEAGVNHNGNIQLAKRLVDVACEAGVDAVKFQTFKAENLLSSKAPLAKYQKENVSGKVRTQYDLIKKLELSFEQFKSLKNYCQKKGILFLSTPFDFESVDYLAGLDVPILKISSGDVTNLPFLEYAARKHKWIILSTGMADIKEISEAVKAIYKTGNKKLILLHCVTEYPAPLDEVNLRAMSAMQKTFKVPVGLSDHTLGIEIAIAAAALGARVVEKHFTLNRRMQGPDHKASLEARELKEMVQSIRNVERALGDGVKRPMKCERKYLRLVRKSLVAEKNISAGQMITRKDIAIKRPGNGIPPKDLEKVLGLRPRMTIPKDRILKWTYLK